jgi:hypothetical protein
MGPKIRVLFTMNVYKHVSKQVFVNPVLWFGPKCLFLIAVHVTPALSRPIKKKSCQLGRLTSNFEFLKNLSSTAILLVILSSKQTFKSAKFRKLGAGPPPSMGHDGCLAALERRISGVGKNNLRKN